MFEEYYTAPNKIRRTLTVVAVVVIVLSFLLRFNRAGWAFLGMVFFYVIFSLIHGVLHSASIPVAEKLTQKRVILFIVSDVLFLSAFLFQYDFGDSDYGWLTINSWFDEESRVSISEGSGILLNWILFVPVFVSWGLIVRTWLKTSRKERQEISNS